MHHLIDLHYFTAVIPYAELAQIVVANWKIIEKETKEYCMTVSNLIKQGARDGQSKKKKAKLVQQREVSSPKEPYVVTAKANRDTKPPIVHYTTSNVDKLAVSSNVMPSSKASMAMNTQGTFNSSTSLDAMNEMCCLPFSTDSPTVLSTSSHRQEVDVPNNSGNQSCMTDSSVMFVSAIDDADSPPREDVEQKKSTLWARSVQLQAAEACFFQHYMFQMTAGSALLTTSDVSSVQRATVSAPPLSDVSSLKDGTTPWPEDEIIPVIANVNRRASIAVDITRANLAIAANKRAKGMAWTKCNEEKVSSHMKINSPPLSYTLPLCQPVSEESSVGMNLCCPTLFDSSHQSPFVDDGVQRSKSKESTYDIEGLSDIDSEVFGMWSSEY
jgi:hypothetical protein